MNDRQGYVVRHAFFVAVLIYQLVLLWLFGSVWPTPAALISVWSFLTDIRLPTLTAASFIMRHAALWMIYLGVVFILGRFVLRPIHSVKFTALEEGTLSLVFGTAALGFIMFALSGFGLFRPVVFWALTLAVWGAGWADGVQRARGLECLVEMRDALFQKDVSGFFVLLWAFMALPIFMAFVPELFYDSLICHIGLPHLYLLEGRPVDLPHVASSRFPQLVNMVYVYALGIGGETMAKFVHVSMGFSALMLIHAVCRRFNRPQAAVVSGLFFFSIPVAQMNLWTSGVEISLSAFTLASLLCILIWHAHHQGPGGVLVLAALAAGSAFGTKYLGAFAVFAMACAVGLSAGMRRMDAFRIARCLILFGSVVAASVSPWLIRNALLTGNPVYPLLYNFFESAHLAPEKMAREALVAAGFTAANGWDWTAYPWVMAVKGDNSHNFFGPLVMAFLPLVIFTRRLGHPVLLLATTIFMYFLFALPFTRHIRYLLPGIFLLSVWVGLATAETVASDRDRGWRVILRPIFAVYLVLLLAWNVHMIQNSYHPWDVVSGRESRQAYSSYYHPGLNPWPPQNIFADIAALPPSARIMIVGDEKAFGYPRPYIYGSIHDDHPIAVWANASASAEDLYDRFRAAGVTHIVLNVQESIRLRDYQLYPWTAGGARVFEEFWKDHIRLKKIRDVDGVPCLVLFAVSDRQTAKRQGAPSIADFAESLCLDSVKLFQGGQLK